MRRQGRQRHGKLWILSFCILAMATRVFGASANRELSQQRQVLGIEELYRLDLLPKLKQAVKVGCVSSYDRTGGNDDGFSGKYSFIRKEAGGLVAADLEGPGIIYRIHTPTPTDDVIEFYFDGESVPRMRLKFAELFDGKHAPFLFPLVGSGVGGHYSYVPLAYQRSCKVVVKAETVHFYQINYAQYPKDFVIPTYQGPPSEAFLHHLEEARKLFRMAGSDITPYLVPAGAKLETHTTRQTLRPGQVVKLFEMANPGRIVGLKLSPASAFAGKDRDILLKMYWDGDREPAVASPVGDLFGYSFGEPSVRSLLLGTSNGTNYLYFPMPFENSARIELVSERTYGPPLEIEAEITWAAVAKAADEGRFYALWRREKPTREGSPYTFLRTNGRGHVVGNILQAQGMEPGTTGFFEGDDRVISDGQLAIPGTGSEDSFNGGWYDVSGRWEGRASFPLSGCLEYKKYLGRTGGYRLMVTDAYSYKESMDYTIEHGPSGNLIPTDYTSVTFFYSQERPTADLSFPAVATRRVVDPERVVFTPGWSVPIHSFSLQNATLTKQTAEIGGNKVRYLSLKATGEDLFGGHHIAFVFDMPSAGSYRVGVKAVNGPAQGIVQMFRDDRPAGEPVNLYAEQPKLSAVLPLGVLEMDAGDNTVFLHLIGKDTHSEGLGLDVVEIVFERVK